VDVCEIAVREFVSALCIHGVTIVHPKMPVGVFRKAVRANEVVFDSSRRFMLVPPALAIGNQMPMPNQLRRKYERIFIEPDPLR
jgi:hypothetical protein